MPWTARKPISQACAKSPEGTAPHSAEAMTKSRVPISITRRCPNRSDNRPPRAKKAASVSR
ncbi:hypothetical protein QF048_000418 [Streptomyces sp. W4I9-2]|nr:hypothetical protein [Streptomyces sp. W4I9-2]